MKKILQLLVFISASVLSPFMAQAAPKSTDKTIYDFSFESLTGDPMPLSDYRGKVILLVNTASKCGFTPQYKGLQALYEKYEDRGLVIIGVPSNDFGNQEPGNAGEIKTFCEVNYGVTFPMTSKYSVTGKDAHPIYKWMSEIMGFAASPKWNFHKYLFDVNGKPADSFGSMTTPDSESIAKAIEKLLPKKE